MRPPARRLVAKFVGMNALSLPGVNMDGACIIIVRTCRTCFFFFLTSSLLWPICQPAVQTLMSKSAGSTIVAFMRSLRFRSNEEGLEIAIHFLWQPYGIMHFIGVERLSKSRQVDDTRAVSVFAVVESREGFFFFRGGGSYLKDFLRRFR